MLQIKYHCKSCRANTISNHILERCKNCASKFVEPIEEYNVTNIAQYMSHILFDYGPTEFTKEQYELILSRITDRRFKNV